MGVLEWITACVILAMKVMVGWFVIVIISLVFGMFIGRALKYCGRLDDCRPWPNDPGGKK